LNRKQFQAGGFSISPLQAHFLNLTQWLDLKRFSKHLHKLPPTVNSAQGAFYLTWQIE
jgi:hypothetical protein